MEYFDTDQITALSVAVEDYYSRFTGEEIDARLAEVMPHVQNSTIHVTSAERTAWNGKQPTITDLATIRSGAVLGATAVQPATLNAHINNSDIHVTVAQKTAWSNKQDAITDLATIRSGAALGATAVQPATLNAHVNNGDIHVTAAQKTAWSNKWDFNADTIKGIKVNAAGTADQLATARNLWGQPFNGTANVIGDMSEVGNISFKTDGYWGEHFLGLNGNYGGGAGLLFKVDKDNEGKIRRGDYIGMYDWNSIGDVFCYYHGNGAEYTPTLLFNVQSVFTNDVYVGTGGIGRIHMMRNDTNYFLTPSGGEFAFLVNGATAFDNRAFSVNKNKTCDIAEGLTIGIGSDAHSILYKGAIELYAPQPYIDFHRGNSEDDYTLRLIEYSRYPNTLSIDAMGGTPALTFANSDGKKMWYDSSLNAWRFDGNIIASGNVAGFGGIGMTQDVELTSLTASTVSSVNASFVNIRAKNGGSINFHNAVNFNSYDATWDSANVYMLNNTWLYVGSTADYYGISDIHLEGDYLCITFEDSYTKRFKAV